MRFAGVAAALFLMGAAVTPSLAPAWAQASLRTISSEAFVARTAPEVAVISCGRGNAFGFPSADVVARWRAAGAEVRRTDSGAVTVVVDSAGALAVDR